MNKYSNRVFFSLSVLLFIGLSIFCADTKKRSFYKSSFGFNDDAAKYILVDGNILNKDEKPHEMVERVVDCIAQAEYTYALPSLNNLSTEAFAQKIGALFDSKAIVFSTPILTNAGRFVKRPLSACAMPPVDLKGDMKKVKQIVDQYHQDGMGTGYNLSEVDDPVGTLRYLNKIAVQGSLSTKEQRPVGNMAILDVDSPHIEAFIGAKVGSDAKGEEWKFNISVNVNDAFMQAAKENKTFTLKDGKIIQAKELLGKIADAAHQCGDPGLISIERLNNDNPTPTVSSYKTTAPCAEVGLAPGETCVFGYINLASFVDEQKQEIDFTSLRSTVELMARALDNILEVSIHHYLSPESRDIMQAKRKIGIGVCGFADLLVKLNIEYTEQKAQDILKDMLSFISYHAKIASVDLAKVRGSFKAINESRYMDEGFILNKYGACDTPQVSKKQWEALAQDVKKNKLLRHATITSLPPTGRSATVIGASQSIEPIFSLKTKYGFHPLLQAYFEKNKVAQTVIDEIAKTGSCAGHFKGKNPFMTATEISYKDHLAMVIAAQQSIDESVSKTVNLPNATTSLDIMSIYQEAYDAGLKGTSIFRDGSRTYQPKTLSKLTE